MVIVVDDTLERRRRRKRVYRGLFRAPVRSTAEPVQYAWGSRWLGALPQCAWYSKQEATFADALAAVRRSHWRALLPRPEGSKNYSACPEQGDFYVIPGPLWERRQRVACYAS